MTKQRMQGGWGVAPLVSILGAAVLLGPAHEARAQQAALPSDEPQSVFQDFHGVLEELHGALEEFHAGAEEIRFAADLVRQELGEIIPPPGSMAAGPPLAPALPLLPATPSLRGHDDDPEALALYREAREHLNRGEMVEAASLFREIHEDHPDVSFAGRAQYYEALARIRQDTEAQRREAMEVLEAHLDQYDAAETVEDARRLVEALREGGGAVEEAMEAVSLDETAVEACPLEVARVRQAAFHALTRRDGDQMREVARDIALSDDPCDAEVRPHALFALGRNAEPEDVEILVDVVRHGDDTRAREQAAAALGQSAPGDAGFEALLALAQERDLSSDLRRRAVLQAIQALRRGPEDVTGERLVELYEAVEDDEDLIRPVVMSLSQVRYPEALAVLMDVARSTDDPEIQQHAIHALGNVDDPEVDALLRELLGRDPR